MNIEVKIDINKKPKVVYKSMMDVNSMIKWETNFKSFVTVKGPKRKLGSIGNRIYKEPDGTTTTIKEEITELKEGKLIAYQLTEKNFMSYVECKFVDKGDYTFLIEKSNIVFRPRILGLFGLFMKRSMRKRRNEDLIKFKELVEAK